MSGRITRFLSYASVLLIPVCGCASTGTTAPRDDMIRQVLDRQARAWNAGDIDAFMDPYWHSPDLTFSAGGKLTRGWQETLDRYRVRYPTPEDMGRLTFSELEVIDLGPRAALVLGRWQLERDEPVGGLFSLVMRKDEDRWVIVHDHTSRTEP